MEILIIVLALNVFDIACSFLFSLFYVDDYLFWFEYINKEM